MRGSEFQARWSKVFFIAVIAIACSVLPALPSFAAATVNFEGYIFNGSSGPLWGGSVIAGTFAPGFNPNDIDCVYGDSYCNVGAEYYNLGVADGTIRPIGGFAFADSSGFFSGSGVTNEPAGTPSYLFGFHPMQQYSAVLATSGDASYLVPAMGGTTSVHTSKASSFVFGFKQGQAIAVDGTPIPEPTTLLLLLVTTWFSTLCFHRRLRSS